MKHWDEWRKENEQIVLAKRRARRLLKYSVIIAALCAVLLYVGLVASIYEESVSHTPGPLPVETVARFMGIPRIICDNTKSHRVWAECMGVGYNDSSWDEHAYKHRNDD
jgi:hypothetical protein